MTVESRNTRCNACDGTGVAAHRHLPWWLFRCRFCRGQGTLPALFPLDIPSHPFCFDKPARSS